MSTAPHPDGAPESPPAPLMVHCGACQAATILCQPDNQLPHRLLASCPECKTWWLYDTRTGGLTRLVGGRESAVP